jgi:hypothetical protein
MVKQLQVEMLQHCSSASSYMRTCIVTEEHYTDVSTPHVFPEWSYAVFLVFRKQYTSYVSVVPCCMNSTTSTPFLSQKTAAVSILANNVCLNFFSLFGECVYDHCLTALWFQHSEMEPRFHHLLFICCDWEIHCHLCGIALKSQSRSHSLNYVLTLEHFLNPCCTKLVIA